MTPTDSSNPTPLSLTNEGDALVIAWSDGLTHRLPWSLLRKRCPCATCRTESEQPPQPASLLPVIRPEEAGPVRPTGMQPMGHYAYNISFSDGHNTGIYTLEYLRHLGNEASAT